MLILGQLYHWAPASDRDKIKSTGLVVTENIYTHKLRYSNYGVVCLAPTPESALQMVDSSYKELDLYSVKIAETDTVAIICSDNKKIAEVKVGSTIPSYRVSYIGSRN